MLKNKTAVRILSVINPILIAIIFLTSASWAVSYYQSGNTHKAAFASVVAFLSALMLYVSLSTWDWMGDHKDL